MLGEILSHHLVLTWVSRDLKYEISVINNTECYASIDDVYLCWCVMALYKVIKHLHILRTLFSFSATRKCFFHFFSWEIPFQWDNYTLIWFSVMKNTHVGRWYYWLLRKEYHRNIPLWLGSLIVNGSKNLCNMKS